MSQQTITQQERSRRIGIANLALDTFLPSVLFYDAGRELRMCWDHRKPEPKYDFPARLKAEGRTTAFGYRQRPTGGTGMQAIAQLIRYVRDLPRLPMSTWEYWASETIKLAKPRTLEILKNGGYVDAKKTCCVLCGDADFKRGLDWWSLDGVVGPCCRFGCCQDHVQGLQTGAYLPSLRVGVSLRGGGLHTGECLAVHAVHDMAAAT